ncbi:uncharacterized protein LOC121732736 [Aricia agestis]|uniref:uncharacterized protein LOC121732736 n=1 Tax=Aricia agestis TaxID=91739 RepID=UPI001C203C3C|nr:uncharacterized protein LOC121732736 [Aricia agestis]
MKSDLNIKLKQKCEQGISDVWKLRSSLCQIVSNISDECDIWALLVKPICPELLPVTVKVENIKVELKNEHQLQLAKEKRERLIAERDRLRTEPDKGEEFIRIKNALNYSINNIADIKKRSVLRTNRHIRWFSNKTEASEENAPIKFSTSPAARRGLSPVIRVQKDSMPWYQPFSIVGSVAIFLIYFCFIREENDLDLEFNKTLYERIKGLEKHQLLQAYKFNKENGYSVEEIETRLKEIELEEAKSAA